MKFIYNCEPLFITVFFIYRIPCGCVIKFAVKSSIFVSTETKYVSQIYCGSCHRQAFQAFAIPLLFNGKRPDCMHCLTLPGKIVMCQSSVEWNKFRCIPSSTECNSLIFVYHVTFHFIQSPFLLVKIPQQLTLQSEFLMLRTFFFSLQMIVRSSSWRIGHVNFSRQLQNSSLMVPKMVTTWRVGSIKARAPGKLTSCEEDFACLVWPSREKLSYNKVQFKKFCPPVKTNCPTTENVNKNSVLLKAQVINMLLYSILHHTYPDLRHKNQSKSVWYTDFFSCLTDRPV